MAVIPVVDFSPYSLNVERGMVDEELLISIAEQICHSFTDTGFVYLKNHGISKSDIESMFSTTKEFFEQPLDVKKRYAKNKDAKNNHGWVARETESLNPERKVKDYKESFDYQLQESKEVKPRSSEEYIPATPIPDTVVINLGDSMQRWTADKLVAGRHRVQVPPDEKKSKQGRQSIALFVHADDHVMLECLDKSNKYEPISSIDYLQMKFNQVY
ncbi:hypothetical protein FSP39_009208 [Pinctada imbricata]|uniref:Non-haem dioxygenase N-terminal domain-containing protein n=1 Tax=Pinctada imbricata TaxID=66713 RepID=A0AA88YBB0_PINIB|nr:hypothetical protein FSP39_009208 [Pinctada imbricata]